jgi:DNA-binding response OmpR family regulator
LIAGYKPDFLLLDFALNGINGGELCRQLKNDENTARLKVMLISAFPKEYLSPDVYGCDDFIAKPFDLYDLIARINLMVYDTTPG